jgi:hypothetical protein
VRRHRQVIMCHFLSYFHSDLCPCAPVAISSSEEWRLGVGAGKGLHQTNEATCSRVRRADNDVPDNFQLCRIVSEADYVEKTRDSSYVF